MKKDQSTKMSSEQHLNNHLTKSERNTLTKITAAHEGKPVDQKWGDYDPSRGRPLKSREEALEWQKRNREAARKRAAKGWATRRKRGREMDAAIADAVARDDR